MNIKQLLHIGKIIIGATAIIVGAVLCPPVAAAGAVLLTIEILNWGVDAAEKIIDDLEDNSSKTKILKVSDKSTSTDDLSQDDGYESDDIEHQGLGIDSTTIDNKTNLDQQGNIDTLGNDNVIIHESWV